MGFYLSKGYFLLLSFVLNEVSLVSGTCSGFRARPFDTPKFHIIKRANCCTLLPYEALRHTSIYQYINNKEQVDE